MQDPDFPPRPALRRGMTVTVRCTLPHDGHACRYQGHTGKIRDRFQDSMVTVEFDGGGRALFAVDQLLPAPAPVDPHELDAAHGGTAVADPTLPARVMDRDVIGQLVVLLDRIRTMSLIRDDRLTILIHPSNLTPSGAGFDGQIMGIDAVVSDLGPGVVIRP